MFTVCLGPFTFFNAQKTKYLQILTSLMRWIGKILTFLFHNPLLWCLLFLHPHRFPFYLCLLPFLSSIPPALVCVAAVRGSVHHGSDLLCVFDSHLLSFLSLTGLTGRPRLDWTVTHRATDENKPPVLGPLLKSQHHWIMALLPPPHSRVLARINNTQIQQHPRAVHYPAG